VRLLLDTHALLWWVTDSENLSTKARQAIGDRANEVLISAASVLEIAIKYRLGRLPNAEAFVYGIEHLVRTLGFFELPISLSHAKRAGLLPIENHKDPFDRMLIAQALAEDLQLVSNEAVFDSYFVHRLW
jgi:PIN domain nuclease of toxin-antitoxin system